MGLSKNNGILVVDNHEDIADLLKGQLLNGGYIVYEF